MKKVKTCYFQLFFWFESVEHLRMFFFFSGKISKIFITHLHGDHLFGLPGLLCTLGNGMDPANGPSTVVELYGPVGIRRFVTTALSLSRSPLVFR